MPADDDRPIPPHMVLLHESIKRAWTPLIEDLNLATESINEALRRFQQDLKKQAEKFAVDLSASIRRMEPDARKLGRLGWTIPMTSTPAEVAWFAQQADDPKRLDEATVTWLNDTGTLTKIQNELVTEPALQPWWSLLVEIVESYNDGRFRVCVPSLFSILWGVIISNWEGTGPKGRPRNIVSHQRKLHKKDHGILYLIWCSVDSFVETTFGNHPYEGEPPERVNCNWATKGYDGGGGWSPHVAVRLMLALHTMLSVVPEEPTAE